MPNDPLVHVVGSLRNPRIPDVGNALREDGFRVFDDWFAGGERADDAWMAYEKGRGRTYKEALKGDNARHVFLYDYDHLSEADIVILVLPAGRSAHMEFGWAVGKGKLGYILLDGEPERWDVMYLFAYDVAESIEELRAKIVLSAEDARDARQDD